ncbi:MAG: dihydropteroate synthase [Pseudorhodobacter sp.]
MMLYRPIPRTDPARPAAARWLAGGWCWFAEAEILTPGQPARAVPVSELPLPALKALTGPRTLPFLPAGRPALMGILNVTPDSFSDGGRFLNPEAALIQARGLIADGADILDIGGESTRPGAADVTVDEEISRTAPVIAALRAEGVTVPISIDTRKAAVARAALEAGADLVNDVAALGFDAELAPLVAARGVPLCLMHAQGDPATMQDDPRYDDVLSDVYAFLEARLAAAEAAGIPRTRLISDPGIGFGKTVVHNLALIARISVFHMLGCPVLLGASRKRFIGTLTGETRADRRVAGSIAVALAGAAQGVQILRVHDIRETKQALTLWHACQQEQE